MKIRSVPLVVALLCATALTGCAHQPEPAGTSGDPGFLLGLFHGFSAPVTLELGWLWHGRVYAFPNTGWTYDLGFLLGLGTWGGSVASASRS